MGRDLLAEDYMLKQITASMIYPEDEVGKKFWKRVYDTGDELAPNIGLAKRSQHRQAGTAGINPLHALNINHL